MFSKVKGVKMFCRVKGEKKFFKDFDVYWRDYKGTIPADALPTGHGTFIAQMTVITGLVPGTLYPDKHTAVSEAQMKKVETESNIKVLCTRNPTAFKWECVNTNQLHGDILKKCVPGGYALGHTLYIGKIFHEGEWKIGKVFPPTSPYKGLRSWYNSGDGYPVTEFQILMRV